MKKTIILILLSQICIFQFLTAQDGNSKLFNEIETAFNSEDFERIIANKGEILNHAEVYGDTTSAEMLYFLGDAYLVYDSLESALVIMQKEVDLRKKIPSTDPILIADAIYNLAYIQQLADNFSQAKVNITEAAELYKNNLGISSPAYVESRIELAKIHGVLGEHKTAMDILENLLKIDFVLEQYQHVVNKELGMAYFDIGYYSKSEDILKDNLIFIEENFGKQSIDYAEALVTLAIPYYYRSQYSDAELLYTQALDIINKISGNELLEENTKNNLALLYWKIGLYEESVNIFQEILDKEETLNNAITFNNYAQNLIEIGEQDSALYYFDKSLKVIKSQLGVESELYIRVLKEKALALNKANDIENYYKLMNESFLASQKILDKSNPEYSKYELKWGIANFRMNNIKQAEKHINSAHQLRTKYLNKKHPLYAETSKELAELTWFKDDPKKAKNYFKETFDNYFAQIEAYFPALSEQQKANFYTHTLRSTFEEFNSFAIAYKDQDAALLGDMYDYQLATKGLIMYATAKARKDILASDNEKLKQQYKNWISTKELISQLYSMSEEELKQQDLKLDSLIEYSSVLEKELSRASSEFEEAYAAKNYNWKDVQAKLKDNEAAIEMIRFREFTPDSSGLFKNKINYAALLIDKKSKYPELILFENGFELENKYIKNYKNAIRFKVQDKYSYDFYWKPIAAKTKKYDKLYFSPDGIYNQISINVLFNNETDKFVLEEQNIQLLTNTKDLIAYREGKPTSNLASAPTLFGFPNYNKGIIEEGINDNGSASDIVENASLNRGLRGSLQRYIRGNSLVTALPGTKEEVNKIETLYENSDLSQPKTYLANEADETQIKSVQNPRVLHIATHGFFLEDNQVNNSEEEDKYSENPLLKSGLIMAGANSFITTGLSQGTRQDGILTAYEAMNMNLTNTELVVLSACETGLGELKNGEGVYGLRRAFQVAGAEAIIMSLWSVDDEATQELMTAFYENWIGGKDKLSAFNDAQKTIKDKYKAPFYWGAFVMVGE
ncbi:CHAT domain-containing tetratricopeptide repeat protein [Marivirga sp.]|uniref:CHAT domain-containing protein n=1 Tax=Marivirga sp. TaxID=2018662 RepID=UPI002D7EB6DC|nr:CHAT domain-containing tetratricopeptide repeat protein [Marivirga sp.]HET8861010.1 CHAT domain-containing tetratricopeptide repeat protein [Marivirga sp.]